MNMLMKAPVYFRFQLFQCRQLCDFYNISKIDRDVRIIEKEVRLNIADVFSKETVKPEAIQHILKVIRYDIGRFSNNLTKDLFDKVWMEVKKKNISVDINHINQTMAGLLGNRIEFDPTYILKEIKENKLSLNNETLDLLLKSYCIIGDMESSLKLIDKMNSLDIYFNSTKYSWLIACAIRNGNFEKVDEYFQKIDNIKSKITNASYGFIASAYASKLDVENCIKMLEKVENVVSNYRVKSINKYDAYNEFVKNGASDEVLLQFIDYMNTDENFTELLDGTTRLNKKGLFQGSLLLIKHTKLKFTIVQWKLLVLRFLSVNSPRECLKYLISKLENNVEAMTYILQFYRPLDEALVLCEKYISYDNIVINERLTEKLMNNAANEVDPVKGFKKVLTFLRSRIAFNDYYTIIVTKVLKKLLSVDPKESYNTIIDIFTDPSDSNDRTNFIFCCVLHSMIFRSQSESLELRKSYFGDTRVNFLVRIRNLSYLLFSELSTEDVCGVLLATSTFMTPHRYLRFLEDVLNDTLRFQTPEVFEEVFRFVVTNTAYKDSPRYIEYLKKNRNCSEEILRMIEQCTSKTTDS